MTRVLLRGPALTQSGYGIHCRQVARWLLSKPGVTMDIQALPWGITSWIINPESSPLINSIMANCRALSGTYDISFQVQLPNEWDPQVANFNVGITASVETDRCNPEWIKCIKAMDTVVVPSNHAKMSILNVDDTVENLVVIPEAFPDEINSDGTANFLEESIVTPFNLLIFGQLTGNHPENDRKNIFHTIRLLCSAFAGNPNVGIIIKTNSGKSTKIDRQITRSLLHSVLQQIRPGPYPKFYFLHGNLNDSEVAGLYSHPKVNALVSLTRGEGFGLPILEAAASGLPVIATGWSAYLDFMDHGRFIKIDYDLVDIPKSRVDNTIFMAGAKWAEANEADFCEKIIKFYKKHDIPKTWAVDLAKTIKKKYSFSTISQLYDEQFLELLS